MRLAVQMIDVLVVHARMLRAQLVMEPAIAETPPRLRDLGAELLRGLIDQRRVAITVPVKTHQAARTAFGQVMPGSKPNRGAAARLSCGARALRQRHPRERGCRGGPQVATTCALALRFEYAQPLRICGLRVSVLGSPPIKGGVTEAPLSAELFGRHAILGLPEKPNDLILGESALFHCHHSAG